MSRDLTQGVRTQATSLDFTTEALSDVARDLRFKLGDAGIPLEDIVSSGLGYANLLYIATVIVELAKARDADLTLFLVEEPEAHLHPQLQMLMLDFLLLQANKSAQRAPVAGKPEGRIQIVVTTHSPNLTAWVGPEHIVVVRSAREQQDGVMSRRTVAIPIDSLGMSDASLKKVSRYVDVTRSALLFGDRALLVEGIAEALLLPAIAKLHVLQNDAAGLQRFRGAVLVAIDGVDFSPYVEVLLRTTNGASVADRVVVMTDRDPQLADRAVALYALADGFGTREKLAVFTNDVTLEHSLYAAGNADVLREVFLELHPRSAQRWDNEVAARPENDRAAGFVGLMKATGGIGAFFVAQLRAVGIAPADSVVLAHARRNALRVCGSGAEEDVGTSKVARLAAAIGVLWASSTSSRGRERALRVGERMVLELMGAIADGEDPVAAAERRNIDRRWLRRSALALLTGLPRSCANTDAARTAWVEALHGRVRTLGLTYAAGITERRYFQTRAGATWHRCVSDADPEALTAATVHEAKGRQYDAVCLVIPPDSQGFTRTEQLVQAWENRVDDEAKRVVYVGLTRARRLAVLAVPEAVRDRVTRILDAANADYQAHAV